MKIEKLVPPLTIEKNDGLSIFFIGVGSAFSKMHYQTNVLVQKGGEHLLIDCGTLCSKLKRCLTYLKRIYPSHSHGTPRSSSPHSQWYSSHHDDCGRTAAPWHLSG